MPQQLREINDTNSRSRYLIPNKVVRNATGRSWYRADYELRALRVVSRVRKALLRDFDSTTVVGERVAIANCVDRLLERERVLLQVPLPRSDASKAIDITSSGAASDHTKLATVLEVSPVQPAPEPAAQPTPTSSPLS